ncbi:MAG: stage III sporulation protein AE [Eubacterium sp.]|nr:stage III sporulation protein AE [Eubacterium sp.]
MKPGKAAALAAAAAAWILASVHTPYPVLASAAEPENGVQEEAGSKEGSVQEEAEKLLSDLGLSDLDAYLQQEDLGQVTFSQLVKEFMEHGLSLEFAALGEKLKQAVLSDYQENRMVLVQILMLAIAFSVLLQMTSSLHQSYISGLGFLGVYLILMMLLLRLFLLLTGIVEGFFEKLVEFMNILQPAFCMSVVFSSGSISAGAYYQLLLLVIYLIDTVFAKVLLPVIQAYMVLQLVNYLTEERFLKIAGLLSDSVHWCVKIVMTVLIGLNIVQGLLAPGIDGLKRSTVAGAVRAIPGAGQIMNSMTEILAGSAMLIKNSVGAAALVVLILISFLPLVKTAVFMVLYRALAAFMEPVADKRFCAAVSALGQAAALYLKLMFYAVMLFFLTTAIVCAATTFLG